MAYPVQHLGDGHLPHVRLTAELAEKLLHAFVAGRDESKPRSVKRDHERSAVLPVVTIEVVTQEPDDVILGGVFLKVAVARYGARLPAAWDDLIN